MNPKDKFLDFPIELLQGFMDHPDECFRNIFDYSLYKMVYSIESQFENVAEFCKTFGYKISDQYINSIANKGEQIYDSFEGRKYVWTGIHSVTFRKYFQMNRNEFDLICLLAFLAFKSICQRSRFKKNITNEYLMSRMAGFESTVSIDSIPDKIQEYMKNKSKKKKHVFNALEESFGLVRTEKSRGITFSFTLSRKELELEIMKSKYLKSDEFKDQRKKKEKELALAEFEEWKKKLK